MQKWIVTAGAILALAGMAWAAPKKFSEPEALNRNRACVYPIGGWAIVNCSAAAAAQSSALSQWARYVYMCRSDSYVAWGDESTDEADANDGYIPSGAWSDFATTDTVRYFSCLNVTSDTDCRLIECQ